MDKRAEVSRWLLECWSEGFGQSIESMTGERPQFVILDQPFNITAEGISWTQPLSLGQDYGLAAFFPEEAWQSVARTALQGLGINDPDPDSVRGTFLEILNQSLGAVATKISERLRQEVTCHSGKPEISDGAPLTAVHAEFQGLIIEHGLGATPALLSLLASDPAPASKNAPPIQSSDTTRTLDLLLDVELPVSVSFGRAQIPLKEVLKLTSGSIVELNRTISEPVEVVVNNCVIARGEVVVVDGNYGIRIQEIVSRQERLRTLN